MEQKGMIFKKDGNFYKVSDGMYKVITGAEKETLYLNYFFLSASTVFTF